MNGSLVVDDARYDRLFDVASEARAMGNSVPFDLAEALNGLRTRGPVLAGGVRDLLGLDVRSPYEHPLPTFTALSFAACDRAFRENERFTSYAYNDMAGMRQMGSILLNKIGDEHRRLRAATQSMFLKPASMNWWRPNWIDETVEGLLDRIGHLDRTDLNMTLCARLPLHVVSRGVGLRGEDALTFRDHLLKSMGSHGASPEEKRHSAAETGRMLRELVAARRATPGEDVVSGLLAADFRTADGTVRKLDDDEVLGFSRHLLLAGGGTSWRQLGIAIHALLAERRFWEACLADRALVADAIEESMRWNATGPVFPRLVLEDTELEGVAIPANSRVDVCLGAANRDPARWDDPDRFDIFRRKRAHLGFGLGPHLCLGQHVARQMMSVAINGLLDRFPAMRLDPDAPPQQLTGGLEQRGMSAIPVVLR
ncbi:cytochrome P450 [Sphingomonas solaris]|uniref:Cytochrome P450 n=1 Tax=Alterirhizorhabdus solaris TaxID=2529389 RepID=A0A558RBI3_9SPHN|nr:cytochrome P450 [Sphingomonas solaris]TVV76744.1 cytochrome P450 [Sphingomonas solaris]